MNPIQVLSFKTNNEMKNNIEKCVQQQQQTIVEDDNVQHPTTVMRTLVTHYLRSTQQQNEFRRTLLRVYNSTCPVTKCCIPSVLEACHLIPFSEGGTFKPSNGILLRADIHRLLEKRLLWFDNTYTLYFAPEIRCNDRFHHELHGSNFESNLPKEPHLRPVPLPPPEWFSN
jgi:hypothetical protein